MGAGEGMVVGTGVLEGSGGFRVVDDGGNVGNVPVEDVTKVVVEAIEELEAVDSVGITVVESISGVLVVVESIRVLVAALVGSGLGNSMLSPDPELGMRGPSEV